MATKPMTLPGLRARADKKGVKVIQDGDTYNLVDRKTELPIGEPVTGLVQLEDKINWVDSL